MRVHIRSKSTILQSGAQHTTNCSMSARPKSWLFILEKKEAKKHLGVHQWSWAAEKLPVPRNLHHGEPDMDIIQFCNGNALRRKIILSVALQIGMGSARHRTKRLCSGSFKLPRTSLVPVHIPKDNKRQYPPQPQPVRPAAIRQHFSLTYEIS